jgi:sulfopyruvate decarboxylase TPP-binding subunit
MTAMTKPKITYDEAGNEIEVTIPAAEYKALLELLEENEDRAIFAERRDEETVSWESVKAKLRERKNQIGKS